MTHINVKISKAVATAEKDGIITAGMVGVPVSFMFDSWWDGLMVTAVFKGSGAPISVPLLGATETVVPWEVLKRPSTLLRIGAEGRLPDGTLVIPTTWATVDIVMSGANATDDLAKPPTPTAFDRIMSQIGNMNDLATEDKSSLVAAVNEAMEKGGGVDVSGASVGQIIKVAAVDDAGKPTAWEPADLPRGGGGTTDYTELTNKPKINGVELAGDTSLDALGIGSQSSNSVQTYKTEDIGELFTAPSDYTAWCPGNLRWDKSLGKFVSLLYAAPAHVHSTAKLYVTRIDPDSFVASDPVKCKYLDSDEVTDITPASAGACSFLILSDGTYMMIRDMEDGNTYKFTSADNGETWVKESAVTGYSGSPWNMTELSNGRIIMSDDASKVGLYYSDDKGVNWAQVIPGTAGGGYEAEACILEVEPGKLIAIARYSASGKGYYESGDSEPAILASSMDYGTTWTDWEISTIDNMNASSCTGIVHDGIVEIFATSRWYSNGSNVNTDNANTGKNGAMLHYMATAKNAMADNFTRVGIIDYAKGAGGEYHSPCAAIDDNGRMLIVHMDGGEKVSCNNRYIRGELGGISYACTDNSASTVKSFSADMVTKLLAEKQNSINYLQMALSKIDGSGVTPPRPV